MYLISDDVVIMQLYCIRLLTTGFCSLAGDLRTDLPTHLKRLTGLSASHPTKPLTLS
jgi:hypothetical protein